MFKPFDATGRTDGFDRPTASRAVTGSGHLDVLVALERIGTRRLYARNAQIYREGDCADCWYKVVSGAVRTTRFLPDGRRHVGQFFLSGDHFGFGNDAERSCSAEAVGDVIVMRFPRAATDRLIDGEPQVARHLCDLALRDLAQAQTHMLLLGRMTASERVAHFLLELAERRVGYRSIELPFSRTDIADHLGLTTETVCRLFAALKRDGVIVAPSPHQVDLRDREALEALCDG